MFIVLNFKSKFGNETIKSKNSELMFVFIFDLKISKSVSLAFIISFINYLLPLSLKMLIDGTYKSFKFLNEYFLFKAELKMN